MQLYSDTREGYYALITQAFHAAWENSKSVPPLESPRFEGGSALDDKAKIYNTCQVGAADPSRTPRRVCILEVDPDRKPVEVEVALVIEVLNDCLYNMPPAL